MPKTNRRPHEIKSDDVVIDHGIATGFTAQVGDKRVASGVDTLEEAEKAVRDEIARRNYPEGKEPQIFVIDSGGMWQVDEG